MSPCGAVSIITVSTLRSLMPTTRSVCDARAVVKDFTYPYYFVGAVVVRVDDPEKARCFLSIAS